MVRWHHRLNGHEFEHADVDGEGQGSLACCNPQGWKESDMTEWLNKKKGLLKTLKVPFDHALHSSSLEVTIIILTFPVTFLHISFLFYSFYSILFYTNIHFFPLAWGNCDLEGRHVANLLKESGLDNRLLKPTMCQTQNFICAQNFICTNDPGISLLLDGLSH